MRRVDRAFAAGYLVLLSGAFYIFFASPSPGEFRRAGESIAYQAIWSVAYATLIWRLGTSRDALRLLWVGGARFLLLCLSALVSYALLPPNDAAPMLRFAMYCLTAIFASWLAAKFSPSEVMELIYRLAAVLLACHWLLAPMISAEVQWDALERETLIGTSPYGGIFGHKNLAGAFFGYGALISLERTLERKGRQCFYSGAVAVGHAISMIAAGSIGPVVALSVALWISAGLRLQRISVAYSCVYWLSALVVAISVGFMYEHILGLLGRDPTLTGRTILLSVWPDYFLARPLFGYGFAAFQYVQMPVGVSPIFNQFAGFTGFDQSHLELLLQLGVAGTLVFASIYWRAIATGFRCLASGSGLGRSLPLTTLAYVGVLSVNESFLVLHNHFTVALVFYMFFLRRDRVCAKQEPR